jgi:hypothetical protein
LFRSSCVSAIIPTFIDGSPYYYILVIYDRSLFCFLNLNLQARFYQKEKYSPGETE